MFRKTAVLAVAGLVSFSGVAVAADAPVQAQKSVRAGVEKAVSVAPVTIDRASAKKRKADQAIGNADLLLYILMGVVTVGVASSALNDDETPASP